MSVQAVVTSLRKSHHRRINMSKWAAPKCWKNLIQNPKLIITDNYTSLAANTSFTWWWWRWWLANCCRCQNYYPWSRHCRRFLWYTPTFISSPEEDMNGIANVLCYHRHLADATTGLQTTPKEKCTTSASLETLSAEFEKKKTRKINKAKWTRVKWGWREK